MRNGQSWSHPGNRNPDVIGYAGPIDPEVGVVGVWDEKDKLIGCLVNFSCHATTNPGGISANWIYYLEKVIQGAFGKDVKVVFLQGACGDVTQVDNLSPYQNPEPERWAQLVGGRVGAEAVKVLLGVTPGTGFVVDARSTVLSIPRRHPKRERVSAAADLLRKNPDSIQTTEGMFAKELVLLDAIIKKQPVAKVEVQAIQLGPAVWISNPAEFFVELGLELKRGSGFALTFPVELANGCVGYVPTEEAFGPAGGGYETRLTSYSNLEPAAGRKMVEAGLRLARQLTPEPVPTPEKITAPGQPWSYGNVAPELD
jgi:hypothetical protein